MAQAVETTGVAGSGRSDTLECVEGAALAEVLVVEAADAMVMVLREIQAKRLLGERMAVVGRGAADLAAEG